VKSNLPRVVEIIGPAGAGKTTLCQALNQYPKQIRWVDFPDVRNILDAPFFIWYGLSLFLTLLRLSQRDSRRISRREFAWLTILKGWPSNLAKDVKRNDQVIILDQGPVYLLAEMREFGPQYLTSPKADIFWQKIFSRWAATLDMIVWLDTADECLVNRIRNRTQEHMMKDESPEDVSEFLAQYRKMFEDVLSRLKVTSPGLRVLYYDTGQQQSDEIVKRLWVEFGLDGQIS
jgi:adenylate kinase family enzyme